MYGSQFKRKYITKDGRNWLYTVEKIMEILDKITENKNHDTLSHG